ncbi:MAG: DNA topoisomerase IB [Acetobacteraceae bacterium]
MSKASPRKRAGPRIPLEPRAAAQAAKLRHVSDDRPGITRIRTRSGFGYRHPDGSKVTDEATLTRIRTLAIPPAYEQVWICPDPDGHLQAVGRDTRGRKQYRYHKRWREVRDQGKYGKMLLFGRLLPKIPRAGRRRSDAARPAPREGAGGHRPPAGDHADAGRQRGIRPDQPQLYGLTTLRNRHVKVEGGSRIRFDFRGKHGTVHHIDLRNRSLAAIVRRCQDLPGQDLFQYLDEEGAAHSIGSEDVNEYLRAITGDEITAKDFRTWAGTNLAALALRELASFDSAAGRQAQCRAGGGGGRAAARQHTGDLPQMLYPPSGVRRLSRWLAAAGAATAGR